MLYELQWGLIRKLIQFRLVCVSCTLLVVALSTTISTPAPPSPPTTHIHIDTHTNTLHGFCAFWQKLAKWAKCEKRNQHEWRQRQRRHSPACLCLCVCVFLCVSVCVCVCVCLSVCTGAVDYVSRGRCAMEPEGYVLRITIHLQLQQEMNPELPNSAPKPNREQPMRS